MTRMLRRSTMLLLCGGALSAMPMLAQPSPTQTTPAQTNGAPPPPPPDGGPRRGGPERRLEMLQHELNLTPDQTTQVKALFADGRTKMEALRSNSALSQDERRTQMMAIRRDEEGKLKALLTPDQVTKYDAMQARMRERMQQRQQGGDAPPPPPGAPQV